MARALFKIAAVVCVGLLVALPARAAQPQAPEPEPKRVISNGLYAEEIISASELKERLERGETLLVLDARSQTTFDTGHIKSAMLPRDADHYQREQLFAKGLLPAPPDAEAALKKWMSLIPKDRPIVTYCNAHCGTSSVLLFKLKGLGFTNVRSMEEGYQEWDRKAYPVEKKN